MLRYRWRRCVLAGVLAGGNEILCRRVRCPVKTALAGAAEQKGMNA